MCVMFDGAMGFLIPRSLQCAHTEKRRYRIADGIFALGFLLGLACRWQLDRADSACSGLYAFLHGICADIPRKEEAL